MSFQGIAGMKPGTSWIARGTIIIGPEADDVLGKVVWAVAVVYLCCAALRLARFNVETGPGRIERGIVKVGDEVDYTITLYNNSSDDAPDMECTITDAQIGFSKDVTLASGASDTSTVLWTVPDGASDPYLNEASVSCSPSCGSRDPPSWSSPTICVARCCSPTGSRC